VTNVARILLVEDNPGDARLIREMLSDVPGSTVTVTVAATLAEGLDAARESSFDAMLLDLSLPDSTGLDTIRTAKQRVPTVPIIVLTGTKDDEVAATAVREGAQDYLVKGFVDGDVLERAIRYAVERKGAERQLEEYSNRLETLVAERTAELTRVNERLIRATEAKSRFLASMSHELRTPLNSIIGFSGVLLQGLTGPLTEEQADQIGMIQRSGKQLLALISDVLDIARIEAGRIELNIQPFPVGPFVQGLVASVRPLADEKGLVLRVTIDDSVAETDMHSDAERVEQVLLNLLSNAVKFTDTGGVGLEVGTSAADMVFVVRDTGPGISRADIERVFEEFEQVAIEGAKPNGTGLGLAISRELAALLGGSLAASSSEGRGSAFTFRVPREYAEQGDR